MQINLVATPEQPRVRTFNNASTFYLLGHVIDDFPSISPYNYGSEVIHYLTLIRPSLEQYFNRRLPLSVKISLKYIKVEDEDKPKDEVRRIARILFPSLGMLRSRYPYPHSDAYYAAYRRILTNETIGLTLLLIKLEAVPMMPIRKNIIQNTRTKSHGTTQEKNSWKTQAPLIQKTHA